MKKVLHLRSSGALLGAETVILELAKNSKAFGYESVIGAINNDEDPYPEFLIPAKNHGTTAVVFNGKGQADLRRLNEIKKFVRDNQIDIVHSHGYKEDFYSALLPSSLPLIATNHLWKRTSTKDYLYTLMDTLFLRRFSIVVGVSSEITSHMLRLGLKKTVQIANGIDCSKFANNDKRPSVRTEFGIGNETIVLGMVSSLTPEKGHRIAIEALSLLKNSCNVTLLIVGDGPQKSNLVEQTAAAGLQEKVIFAGKRSNIPEILSSVDIFLMPSFTEGLPMALLEAMAAGKPVIASSVGEITNVLSSQQCGKLIEPGNPHMLATSIHQFIKDTALRERTGALARERVLKKYSSIRMTQNYCRLYTLLLHKRKKA